MAEGAILKQFGVLDGQTYFFPPYQDSLDASFASIRSGLLAVTGDGSLDRHGAGRAPLDNGTVRVSFTLRSVGRSGMAALRDAVGEMHAWGVQPLIVQASDGSELFCWARLQRPDIRMNPDAQTDLHQPVNCTFEVAYPRWMSRDGLAFIAGPTDGTDITLLPPRIDRVSVTDGDTVSVTNNGNIPARVLVVWHTDGASVSNPGLRRRDFFGQVVESLQYGGTISAGDDLYIDARAYLTQPESAYADLTYLTADWLTIPPGTSDLEVYGLGAGESALLSIDYMDEWV
jgi:hypothetical protein